MSYEPTPGTACDRALSWLEGQPSGTEVTASKWAEALNVGTANLIVGVSAAVMHGALERFTKHGQAKPYFYKLPNGAAKRARRAAPPPVVEEPEVKAPPAPRIDMLLNGAAPAENDEPKGLAGAARGPVTSAKETTDGRIESADIAETRKTAIGAGDDAKRDGVPASPRGQAQDAELEELAATIDARYPLPKRKPKASSAAAVERTQPPDKPAPARGPLRFGHWSSGEFAFERGGEVVDVFTPAEAALLFAFVRRIDTKEVSRET